MLTPDDTALQAVRRRHELRVLHALVTHGNRTRRELESDTKLSRTTLSTIIGELRTRGVLAESDQEFYAQGRNGRPTKVLSLNSQAGAAIGLELGRRKISISVAGFDGTTVLRELRATSSEVPLARKVELAADLLGELLDDGRINKNNVIGMAVGIASRHADPASLADGLELQKDPRGATLAPLRELVNTPLLWDNNIRLAAMAYCKENENLLYVVLSAGISSAIVANGEPLRGGNGNAGELGHMSVDFGGPACWCGRHGCLESFINEANILKEAMHRGQAFPDIDAMAQAAEAGNGIAINVISWAGELLARAVVGACVLIDPSRVVFSGEISQFGEQLLAPVRRALDAQNLELGPGQTEIETVPFAASAGSDGAALMALKHWSLAAG